jgi:hypothetical protein
MCNKVVRYLLSVFEKIKFFLHKEMCLYTKGEFVCLNENGQYHCFFGPAVEWEGGTKEWWINGKLHREGGPAVETATGTKYWYMNGKLHRVNGPAIEYVNGIKAWFINGKNHRIDGPAYYEKHGNVHWSINGILYTKPMHNKIALFSILESEKIDLSQTKED